MPHLHHMTVAEFRRLGLLITGANDMAHLQYMTVTEFRRLGYLQELNRQFLHPLGLALEVVIDTDDHEHLGMIWDGRADPQGFFYEQIDTTKAANIAATANARHAARRAALGFVVQPVECIAVAGAADEEDGEHEAAPVEVAVRPDRLIGMPTWR